MLPSLSSFSSSSFIAEGDDTFFSCFFWKAEGDVNCRPLLFVLFYCSKKEKATTILLSLFSFSGFFLEGKKVWQLPSPSFCFVLLQQDEEEGDDTFAAIAFFFGFFWNT
jgi:hypothetical protein